MITPEKLQEAEELIAKFNNELKELIHNSGWHEEDIQWLYGVSDGVKKLLELITSHYKRCLY